METALADGADQKTLNAALLEVSHSVPLVVDGNRREVDFSPRYAATARLLLEKGANLEARDENGSTPLLFAASNGELLLEKGAKIWKPGTKKGETALIAAAEWGRVRIVEILLDKGARIEARDNMGETALMLAASHDGSEAVEIVKMLLSRGADLQRGGR